MARPCHEAVGVPQGWVARFARMDEIFRKLGVNVNVSFHLIFLGLIWVRVLGMTAVVPFLFGKPVPRYAVVGASMVLALFVYPNILPRPIPELPAAELSLVILFIKEAFYGLAIGFSASILFYALESVGQMIDNQRGVSIARLLIPQLGEQGSISGLFLFQLGIVIYLVFGGHLLFLDAFFRSYQTLPVLGFPAAGPGLYPLMDLFMRITGEVLYIALQMSAPIIIAIFMADIILGIANRVAPQINVWEMGFHVKGYVGILLLFLALTMIAQQMEHYSRKSNYYANQVIELLQGKVPEGLSMAPVSGPEEGQPNPDEGIPQVKTMP